MGKESESAATENTREDFEVMDTPDRCKNNQIATSTRKFEDSPVYSFLNNLSPLKPIKSTQTINPHTFVSLPSVFTSPHVSSLKEYRSLQRYQLPDPSKPEFSSDNGNVADKSRSNMEVGKKLDEQKENRDPGASNGEMANRFSKAVTEFAQNLSYDCKSPNSNLRPISALIDESSQRKENLRGLSQIDQNKESSSCDWESLISDVLVFESPNDIDSYRKEIDHGTSFYTSMENEVPNTNNDQVREGSELENLSTQPGEGNEMMENEEIRDINNPSEKMNIEEIGFYRGMRRRCLVFEMAEARRKQLDQNSGSDSPALLQSNEQQLVATGNESSRCVLPGIGLHLNALAATTPNNYKIVSYESSAYGRFLIGPSSSSVNIQPSTNSQEPLNNTLALVSSEREFDAMENGVFPMEDACDVNGYIANEDIYQSSSPKKKRRRSELAVDGESCKRCNCKKSKCLKLYCECFAAGVYCVEPCACIDCFNKPIHEDTVLATRKQIESRNPLAFAPKVIRNSDSVIETGDDSSKTPASARHKRGCNCKKSGCLKKYCECYQGGVGCSINCRCEGCKNAFGRKDGSCMMGTEVEMEEDEADVREKSVVDKSLEKTAIQNELQQNMDSAPLATPLRGAVRQSATKNKPPRSSFTCIGGSSSSSFVGNQVYDKPSFFQPPPPKFEKRFETVWEDDEIPEFLQGDSPISGVKSSSPNQKRVAVSPPHTAARMSPGLLRSSRKLILQSISSFPSLGSTQ